GRRVPKESARIEAYGTVDELNSQIGAALSAGLVDEIAGPLAGIQNDLFHLGSDLCIPEEDQPRGAGPRIEQRHVVAPEPLIDRISENLRPLENFVLPGGSPGAAALHLARTVCRRAERRVIALSRAEPIGPFTVTYLNRLSDALFVMARFENKGRGVPDRL